MRLRASEVATLVRGRLVGPEAEVDGAAVDSRSVVPGQLFVPILAERDGHDYVADALAAGAGAYLTARVPQGGSAVVVADTRAALTALGAAARRRLPGPVVGVTGSVGKTSVKDLLAAALAPGLRTWASPRSFNNELGVPLTLLSTPDDAEVVVIEMGSRGRGHVRRLCAVARPTVGVVTVVAAAHTETFGSLDDVAEAKGELVEALPAAGTAVLNADDARVSAMADRTAARVLRFGLGDAEHPGRGAGIDVCATAVRLDSELRPSFTVRTPWGAAEVRLAVRGLHQVGNALAAAAAALACGAGLEQAVAGLAIAELSPWRMELRRAPSGALVLNDAYNANPASMAAALRALAQLDAHRRVAVLGTMAELGGDSTERHREVAALAAELGIEVLAVAEPAYGVETVPDLAAATARLGPLGPGDAVLVKGSRVAGLERLAATLLDPPG